ncbi:MAG: PorP/SprF family type IX secretion system membrane protein [Thermoanaerobaculia bacterium]|nr:PorP/SprF family type IX secretion system membrane protein [Thermoanaerobaculia bacterium]
MHCKKLLTLFSAVLIGSGLWAQDIHFTQYYMSPMTLNPSMAGKFEGTARIGGIYRDQWSSVIKAYRTPSAWVDAPIIRGFRKRDWIGVGFMLYQDKAGTTALSHGAAKLGATYHLALDRKGNAVLSLGGHYGGEQRKIDPEKLRFGDGYNSLGDYVSSLSKDDGRIAGNANYTDIDLGINLSSRLNKKMDFNLGFSMFHLTKPNYSLVTSGGGGGTSTPTGGVSKLPRRAVAHGQFNVQLDDKMSLSPSFIFQTMSGNDEIMVQAMTGYLINPEKDITLNFGLGYRLSDAINVLAGMKYKDLRVGIAYDVNTSSLSNVSNYRGGFEIAANYIIKIYKPAVVKPKVLCPRF